MGKNNQSENKDLSNKPNEIKNVIEKELKQIDVFDAIPQQLDKSDKQNGRVYFEPFYVKNVPTNLKDYTLQELPPIIINLQIKGTINEYTKVIYAHEITHALVQKTKDFTNDYYNFETIPILVELIVAKNLGKDTYLYSIMKRIFSIKRKSSNALNIETSKYIQSTIQAFGLFKQYQDQPQKILSKILSLFNGKIQVEDILNSDQAINDGEAFINEFINKHPEIEKKNKLLIDLDNINIDELLSEDQNEQTEKKGEHYVKTLSK